jgi:NAD(P)-dependent dehydrogenase (short-subunit alcohol dehydrogenase family)
MQQRVIITAGAGGIGRVMALAFANQGATVHVCDHCHLCGCTRRTRA